MKALLIILLALVAGAAHAGTIYLCKAYNGSTFWASAHCSKHNALIDRMESVADGIPWDQQVQQAERGRAARAQVAQAPNVGEVQRVQRCGQLNAERHQIESRYTNWQWQPPEVINPDQQRMRGLRAELSQNRCASQ
ncbi:hypothetical protein QTH89_04735 [Variovorax sp. J22G21]|uniref:hypothetical protein n=1 Tax=Variovorax fucosicus TaxID=3053517 RepID=UPI002578BECC|nr:MULTISPECIES: hypothetical protein [unclassified Variovorax]MDM0041453.1 hypothetical protein [Variovorax sp. J22R193]MDM0057816.1 hypothetical protein [Variovorax sp. J22G47]MDM0060509.1 hypothetical protein [Variovorax sp. J22G21]